MKFLVVLAILVKITMCEYDRRTLTALKYSKMHVVPTVINGHPASEGQVPYLISIKYPLYKLGFHRTVWENLCGATIISEHKALTAAHCFESNNFYYANHPHILRLVAGNLKNSLIHSGETETTEQTQWRNIAKLVVHADFYFPSDDIALVFADEPWSYTTYVSYAVPATRNTDYPRSCHSAGYGRVGVRPNAPVSPVLLLAPIDIMARSKCSALWEMDMKSFICSDSLVTDVERGDSGGPLVCNDTLDPAEESGRSLLVGVVSGKNYDKTTLYTRVSYYKDWIETDVAVRLRSNLFVFLITLLILIYLFFLFNGVLQIEINECLR